MLRSAYVSTVRVPDSELQPGTYLDIIFLTFSAIFHVQVHRTWSHVVPPSWPVPNAVTPQRDVTGICNREQNSVSETGFELGDATSNHDEDARCCNGPFDSAIVQRIELRLIPDTETSG